MKGRFTLLGVLGVLCTLQVSATTETGFFPIHALEDYPILRNAEKKPHTILIYIAADNDLNYFAWKNIKQMAQIGSNEHVNIVIQISEVGATRPTQRYLIEKGKAILLNKEDVQAGKKLDSGAPQTLIDFCIESAQMFPADHYSLVLWNHGSGILDPLSAKIVHPSEFFTLNPDTLMLELNRSMEYIKVLESDPQDIPHGVCFDDSFSSFLSNQGLEDALKAITQFMGQKFDIIGFDACLMAATEVAFLLKPYANIVVASEEVELGSGWNYAKAFRDFIHGTISPKQLAKRIVSAYEEVYNITPDYTLSAIDLTRIDGLESNVERVSQLLSQCLVHQRDKNIKNIIKTCRSREYCTHFEEPSYIDLGHFYDNMLNSIHKAQIQPAAHKPLLDELRTALNEGRKLIDEAIISRVMGKDFYGQALGMSIYFPERGYHQSYDRLDLRGINAWRTFLKDFLKGEGRNGNGDSSDEHSCIMEGWAA